MAGSPIKNARNRLVRDAILKSAKDGTDPVDFIVPFTSKLQEMALAGDMSAMRELFDRLEGKPAQQLQIGGDGSGEPLVLKVTPTDATL